MLRAVTETLRELRRSRRRHYLREGDWVDSLYKAYIVGILAALGLFYGSVALGADFDAAALHDVEQHGAAVLGLAVAVLVLLGLRSGAHGGPLAPESADVSFLLLAPIPRTEVLRPLAVRQLRGVVLVPAVGGAVAGSIASSPLGGERVEWLLAGAAFGVLASLAVWGSALVASGVRLRRACRQLHRRGARGLGCGRRRGRVRHLTHHADRAGRAVAARVVRVRGRRDPAAARARRGRPGPGGTHVARATARPGAPRG